MNEFDPRKIIDEVFPEDEKVRKTYQDLRDINELVAEGYFDDDEGSLSELISDCDNNLPFFNTVVTLSGKVMYFPYSPEPQSTITASTAQLDGVPVLVKGFSAMQIGEDETQQFGHTFCFDIEEDGFIRPPASSTPQYIGWAMLDEVHIKPRDDNQYNVLEYLETYLPEVLEEIDGRLLNTENEVEALAALGGFGVSHGLIEDVDTQRNMVETYLDSLLEFDEVIPYSALVKGAMHITDEQGDVVGTTIIDEWKSALVVPIHIKMLPKFTHGNGSKPRFVKDISVPMLIADVHEVENGIYEQAYVTAAIPLGPDFKMVSNASSIMQIDIPGQQADAKE